MRLSRLSVPIAALVAALLGCADAMPAPQSELVLSPGATPVATGDATPMATGDATPDASPVATPDATIDITWDSLWLWLDSPASLSPSIPGFLPENITGAARSDGLIHPATFLSSLFTRGITGFFCLLASHDQLRIPGIADFGEIMLEPVEGAESSGYGYRRDPITRRRKLHKGLDFKAPHGTPVRAAGAGLVVFAGRKGGYGRLIIISHGNGLETRYAHLRRISVGRGHYVAAGTPIGTVGSSGRSTGPHLHFEVRRFDEPMDPSWALGKRPPSIGDELSSMFDWLVPAD